MDLNRQLRESSDEHLWKSYPFNKDRFDELWNSDGTPHSQWAMYFEQLEQMGRREYLRRWEIAVRLIRENDITFNLAQNERGLSQNWSVEPFPHLITGAEWEKLEAAMIQRASLLNSVLADLYGPQRLIREGLLPPELVYSHPGFLRACHGIRVPNDTFLHFYAADLAQGADGRWFVLADRTQAPSGAGYALENRIALSRTYPEIFHEFQVHRLANYFQKLQDTLRSLAIHNRDNPRIVLLSPGPFSETYFEHVSLARYLGYPLVEGADLTTRDNCVYLKTLTGLQLVDVVMRNVNDSFCDPLELRYDSRVGVPGLVQVAQKGNVAVVNALGSGVIGGYGFMGFLPGLCRHILGEELLIPSTPTWWCGLPEQLDYVLGNLDNLVIKAAFPGVADEPVYGSDLNADQVVELKERLLARPHDYIGQEKLELATTPALNGEVLEPRHMVLRVYLLATPDGYTMMPGGLTRISASLDSLSVSMKKGGGSKDTWVLSDKPVSTNSLLQNSAAMININRNSHDQPSRVGDNMYWLGRYVERIEGMVRLLRAILSRYTNDSAYDAIPEMPALLRVLEGKEMSLPGTFKGLATKEVEQLLELEIMSLIYDADRHGSLRSTLADMRRTAWIVRDRLSTDTWRILHRLEMDLPKHKKGELIPMSDLFAIMNQMILTIAAFSGVAMESMTRGLGWRFLDIGRRLERSIGMITMIESTLATVEEHEASILQSLLEVADSSMTYRYRYLSTLQVEAVLDLLLTDESNPRSLGFQLVALGEHVDQLPRTPQKSQRTHEQRIMLGMLSELRLAELPAICKPDKKGNRSELLALMSNLGEALPDLSDTFTRDYFSHTDPPRQLSNAT